MSFFKDRLSRYVRRYHTPVDRWGNSVPRLKVYWWNIVDDLILVLLLTCWIVLVVYFSQFWLFRGVL